MSKELHQSEVKRGAENLCGTAIREAARVGEYRDASELAKANHQRCLGELAAVRAQPVQKWSPPLWLVLPLRFVAVGATGAAAYSLARGLPPEVSVGLAVGGLGALVVDGVLTLIR